MTTEELNTIVQAVVEKINEQVVDFDVVSSTPENTDLLSAVRPKGDGIYQGVTLKWDDVANAVTREAKGYRDEAASAKTNVENMKASVDQTVSDFNILAEQKKAEVQGVYQTDLNELKGDLNNIKNEVYDFENYKFEIGSLATSTGQNYDISTRIRSDFIEAKVGDVFKLDVQQGLMLVYEYDENKNFITTSTNGGYWYTSGVVSDNAKFVRVVLRKDTSNSTITEEDIPSIVAHLSPNGKTSSHIQKIDENIQKIDENIAGLQSIQYMSLFKNVCCIGDSLTRGYQAEYGNGQRNRDGGYPTRLSRMTRLNVFNFGHSGATPKSWMNECGTKDFSSFDMAIICLGRNGSLESETDRTNYKAIIDLLKNANENITIFCLSLPKSENGTDLDNTINDRIKSIATSNNVHYVNIYDDVLIADLSLRYDGTHFYPLGYMYLAQAIMNNINKYIDEHKSEFMQIFVPKNYSDFIDGKVE